MKYFGAQKLESQEVGLINKIRMGYTRINFEKNYGWTPTNTSIQYALTCTFFFQSHLKNILSLLKLSLLLNLNSTLELRMR